MARNKELSPATALRDQILQTNPLERIELPDAYIPHDATAAFREAGTFGTFRSLAVGQAVAFLDGLPHRKAGAIRRMIENLITLKNDGKTPEYGILNLFTRLKQGIRQYNEQAAQRGEKPRQTSREVDNFYDPDLGSVILPESADIDASPLRAFYTPDRMFSPQHGGRELRGPNYYVVYPDELSFQEKIRSMQKDMADALSTVSTLDRSIVKTPRDYLMYVGVLDYIKIHALTMFHGVTFRERFLQNPTPKDKRGKQRHDERRNQAFDLAREAVRMYYQGVIGMPFDRDIDPGQILKKFNKLAQFVESEQGKAIWENSHSAAENWLRNPEVSNASTIALGAFEATQAYPETSVVIGIPSGGTELAFCTQLLYELQGQQTAVVQIPISHRLFRDEIRFRNSFRRDYAKMISGKNVLIMDDNSSTSTTIDLVGRAVSPYADQIAVHLAEFDPRRLTSNPGEIICFDPRFSPTTMSVINFETHSNGKIVAVPTRKIFDRLSDQSATKRV